MNKKILVIEDERRMQRILQLLLEENGYQVKTAGDGIMGMKIWQEWLPHVVLTDIKMPRADGIKVLEFKINNRLDAPLIILTAFGTIDMAVRCIKNGAFDYLTKPFNNDKVIEVVKQAISDSRASSADDTGDEYQIYPGSNRLIGSSPAMRNVHQDIAMIAQTRTSVLITGESGTGKELVARSIHNNSNRRHKNMIRVNCAAIPKNLLESELFGHKKGSFTGAVNDREGSFVKAHEGTIFLDEIGDLPIDLQPKLLHAVEEKSVTPIGSSGVKNVNVKVISATNRDIGQMVTNGEFRKDLYFRLNTFHIHLPPLKERIEDIEELTDFFLEYFSREFQKKKLCIKKEAMEILKDYTFPGNVRELRNIIERSALSCQDNKISTIHLPANLKNAFQTDGMNQIKSELDIVANEQELIQKALKKTGGNQVQAAKLLNISRNTLRYRIKKFNISLE